MVKSLPYMDVKGLALPFLRTSLWACMMNSPRSMDGISKLLSKSDVDKLKNSQKRPMVEQAEGLLADSWKLVEKSSLEQSKKPAEWLCTWWVRRGLGESHKALQI